MRIELRIERRPSKTKREQAHDRRRKRLSRRLGRDLRAVLPYLAIAATFLSSATAIAAAEILAV